MSSSLSSSASAPASSSSFSFFFSSVSDTSHSAFTNSMIIFESRFAVFAKMRSSARRSMMLSISSCFSRAVSTSAYSPLLLTRALSGSASIILRASGSSPYRCTCASEEMIVRMYFHALPMWLP